MAKQKGIIKKGGKKCFQKNVKTAKYDCILHNIGDEKKLCAKLFKHSLQSRIVLSLQANITPCNSFVSPFDRFCICCCCVTFCLKNMKTMFPNVATLVWVECTNKKISMADAYHLPLFQSHVIRFDGPCFVSSIIIYRVRYWYVTTIPHPFTHTSAVIQQQNKMVQIQLLIHFKLKDCEYKTNECERERERQRRRKRKMCESLVLSFSIHFRMHFAFELLYCEAEPIW